MGTKTLSIPYPDDLPKTLGRTTEEFEEEMRFLVAAKVERAFETYVPDSLLTICLYSDDSTDGSVRSNPIVSSANKLIPVKDVKDFKVDCASCTVAFRDVGHISLSYFLTLLMPVYYRRRISTAGRAAEH